LLRVWWAWFRFRWGCYQFPIFRLWSSVLVLTVKSQIDIVCDCVIVMEWILFYFHVKAVVHCRGDRSFGGLFHGLWWFFLGMAEGSWMVGV
jgi:hypothetical protein